MVSSMQQILAYETDLLEFDDIFDDNKAIEEKVRELKSQARETISQIDKMGGAINSIEFMKTELVKANTKRLKSIERGDTIIVGVNKFDETYTSPLTNSGDNFEFIDRNAEQEQLNNLKSGEVLEIMRWFKSTSETEKGSRRR